MGSPMTVGRNQSGGSISSFPTRAEGITPSDSTTYHEGRQVFVGGAGDVTVEPFYGNNTVTFSLEAGQFVPVVVRRVLAATTATDLVGVY